MVNGEIVLRDGKLTRIDESEILREVREAAPAYLASHAIIDQRNSAFEPYFAEIHRRATLRDIGLNLRWGYEAMARREPALNLNRACRRRRD
jgi:5-methylthioadenosine/S-adenosylhomocysteine deaminase